MHINNVKSLVISDNVMQVNDQVDGVAKAQWQG
jgi:hypothetical protein